MTTLYKVLAEDGSAFHGGTGTWHLPKGTRPGKWMPKVKGEIALCSNGYHLIPAEGLFEWLGPTIYEAEGRGDQDADTTKIAFREARLIRKLAWGERIARLFAADCAARALNNWRAQYQAKKLKQDVDPRSHAVVVAARDFAEGQIDDAARSAAWSAAWSAAEPTVWSAARSAAESAAASAAASAAKSAAWSAAWSAAASAADSAERAWQLDRLMQYLRGENPEPVPLPDMSPQEEPR